MSDRPSVLTKRDFVRRYQNSEFGNAPPTWDSLADWATWAVLKPTGFWLQTDRLYHIRNRIASGPTYYDVTANSMIYKWDSLITQGAKAKNLYISEMAPTALTLFQGEVCQSTEHLWLTYSLLPFTMREALAKQTLVTCGIMASALLRKYMDDNSYGWLEHLLETYPGHVIEFSVFSKPWGTVPNHNTVFWEVRAY